MFSACCCCLAGLACAVEVDDRRGVCHQVHPIGRQDDQGADMGHGGAGAIPRDHLGVSAADAQRSAEGGRGMRSLSRRARVAPCAHLRCASCLRPVAVSFVRPAAVAMLMHARVCAAATTAAPWVRCWCTTSLHSSPSSVCSPPSRPNAGLLLRDCQWLQPWLPARSRSRSRSLCCCCCLPTVPRAARWSPTMSRYGGGTLTCASVLPR